MTMIKAVGYMLGGAVLLLLLCFGIIEWEKGEGNEKYDERQQIARGKGYRFCSFVGAAYFACVAVYLLPGGGERPQVDGYLLVWFGLLLESMALHLYCLAANAELPLSKKNKEMIYAYLFAGAVDLWILWTQGKKYHAMPLAGEGSIQWLYLTMAVTFFFLAASHLVAALRKEKE